MIYQINWYKDLELDAPMKNFSSLWELNLLLAVSLRSLRVQVYKNVVIKILIWLSSTKLLRWKGSNSFMFWTKLTVLICCFVEILPSYHRLLIWKHFRYQYFKNISCLVLTKLLYGANIDATNIFLIWAVNYFMMDKWFPTTTSKNI